MPMPKKDKDLQAVTVTFTAPPDLLARLDADRERGDTRSAQLRRILEKHLKKARAA